MCVCVCVCVVRGMHKGFAVVLGPLGYGHCLVGIGFLCVVCKAAHAVLCTLQALYAGCATRRYCPRGQGSLWEIASDTWLESSKLLLNF